MGLTELFTAIRSTRTTDVTQFSLPPRDPAPPAGFVPEETYFELRLTQMRLREKRELWRTFVPVLTVLTRSLYDSRMHTVPALIGPRKLDELVGRGEGDHIEFRDVRLAGPLPYNGDDLELLVCLARTATGDWAKQALGMVETIAKAADFTKLATSVSIAGPIAAELEKVLGMASVENRLAVHRHLRTPDAGPSSDSELRPGHLVLIRDAIEPGVLDRMSPEIRDGRLYCTTDGVARPFVASDFVVLELRALAARPDFSTFDFHRVGWKSVREHIWEDRTDAAREAMRRLSAAVALCTDITPPDRRRLMALYKQRYEEELAARDPFATDHGFSGSRAPLDDHELMRAVEEGKAQGGAPPLSLDPDRVAAELGLG